MVSTCTLILCIQTKRSFNIKQVVIGIILNSVEKVLIVQRSRSEVASDGSGSKLEWVFPGGKPEIGETPEQAVEREVKQETGYNVRAVDLISERIHPQFDVNLKYFECKFLDYKVKPITDVHEVTTLKWVDPAELKNYFTTDLDKEVGKFLGL